MLRRLALAALALGLVWGCDDSDDGRTFTLKFINIGHYPVNALWLKPVTDTANWGASVLPVVRLDSMQFVRIGGNQIGPIYAFKVQFDSAGTAAYLTHGWMPTSPDTITAHAALGDGWTWGIGHAWGLQIYDGEQDVTP